MTVQAQGEVVFGASDWAQRYNGVRFGVKIRDFGELGGKVAQLWEESAPNQWDIRDAIEVTDDVDAGNIGAAMTKILTMIRKWLTAKFGNGTAPPVLTNIQKLDAEVQKLRFVPGPPPNVLYP